MGYSIDDLPIDPKTGLRLVGPFGAQTPLRKARYVPNPYLLRLREMPAWVAEGERIAGFKGRWHAFFDRRAPLWLEIGSGKGEFLVAMARRHPEVNFLGLEVKYSRTWKLAKMAKRLDLTNVRFAAAVGEALDEMIDPGEVSRVVVNCPDPWEKKKERKHRLFQPRFLETLYRLLPSDGELHFKTDHEGYFDGTLALFAADPRFEIAFQTRDLHQSERAAENVVTWFEALFTGQGLPTYALVATRV